MGSRTGSETRSPRGSWTAHDGPGGYRWCRHTTAAEGGSKRFVAGVFSSFEVQDMYLIAPDSTRIWTDSNRNFTLREYSRLEYGRSDIGWILASVKASRPAPAKRPKSSLGLRLRYFLNSFRGFAAFDVHGLDDTVVFSLEKTNRFPESTELIQEIRARVKPRKARKKA